VLRLWSFRLWLHLVSEYLAAHIFKVSSLLNNAAASYSEMSAPIQQTACLHLNAVARTTNFINSAVTILTPFHWLPIFHIYGPPLWSSGHSSWLQIQRSGFDSRHYQIFWEVVGLEWGPLSLVSTTEELLGRNSSGSSLENRDYSHRGSTVLTMGHPSICKSWH
jgi:hypothetical protein